MINKGTENQKPTILLTNHYSTDVLGLVLNLLPDEFRFITLDAVNKNNLVQKAKFADYFLASGRLPIDREVIVSAEKLKMIQRTGVGTDGLDLEFLKERGIPVYVNKGVNAESVAEHTVMLILAILRKLPQNHFQVINGVWKKNEHGLVSRSLSGKIIGLIGMGSIAIHVVKRLSPFGVDIRYYKPNRLSLTSENQLNVKYEDFRDLLRVSDILSLHCPLTQETNGLIGKEELNLLKKGSFLINTARGKLIDETALIEVLESGHLSGAALDVYEREPIDTNNRLIKMNNVVLTSHVSGLTLDSFRIMIMEAFRNIQLFHNGQFDKIRKNQLVSEIT